MKKYKYIAAISTVTLLSNTIMPSEQVFAKDIADVWPFEKNNIFKTADFRIDSKPENVFNTNVFPRNIVVPEFPSERTSIPISNFGYNLQNKSIQYVSFIDAQQIRNIGLVYSSYRPGYPDTTEISSSFKNNEIRKLYWNNDDFYLHDITIFEYAFKNNKIQSLSLPNKVKLIKQEAFYQNEISWIEWEGVEALGPRSFSNNKLVSNLPNGYKFQIPKKMKEIPIGAFYNNQLTEVTIPNNILTVYGSAFGNNPINSIYFENANTAISSGFLNSEDDRKPSNYQDIIIYGHGENSTASKFAADFGSKYVNVDQYENSVFDAEESMSEEKLNEAYEKINAMAEGEMKNDYLKRLDNLNHAFDTEKYVSKAEQTLNEIDYQTAKEKVASLDDGVPKTNYTNRLNLVLKGINNAKYIQIQQKVNEGGGELSLEELNELQEALVNIGGTDALALKEELEAKRKAAEIYTYKLALSYLNHAKNYQTLKNVTNAQKIINNFPDGYKLAEEVELTYTEPYLKDGFGNNLIDEDASYKKITETRTDESGIDYGVEVFETDASGNKVLKDGLTSPVYVPDPLYNTTYTVTEEKGSKAYLQGELDKFSNEVYTQAAVDIAKKYMTQEKLDDALLLMLQLEDSDKKADYAKQIEDIQKELDELNDQKDEINKLLLKYEQTSNQEVYNKAIELINKIENVEVKKDYINQISSIQYKIKLKAVMKEGEINGLTKEAEESGTVYLAMIDQNDAEFDDLYNEFAGLVSEYLNYNQTFLDLQKEFDNVDITDPESLTKQKYNELRDKVFNVKTNNPNKNTLTERLNKLYNYLNKLNENQYEYELLEEEIQFMKSNFRNVSIDELKNLTSKINQIDNAKKRKILKDKYDDLVQTIVRDYQFVEIVKSDNLNQEYKDKILSYVYLINSSTEKETLKSELESLMKTKITELVTGTDVVNILNGQAVPGSKINVDDLINLIDTVDGQADVIAIIDDKVVNKIDEVYKNPSSPDYKEASEMGLADMKLLADLFAAINDISQKEAQAITVNNIVNEYIETSYPEITNNNGTYTTNEYKDLSTLSNYFDGIHMDTYNQDFGDKMNNIQQIIDDSIKNDIFSSYNDNSKNNTNNSSNSSSHVDNSINSSNYSDFISQQVSKAGDIFNQETRNQMYDMITNNFEEQLLNFDFSRQNALSNLTDLSSVITTMPDQYIQQKLGDVLANFVEDNSQKIYDTSTINDNESTVMKFLSDYISQDEINKLIHNDHDNVIGVQTNNDDYKQDYNYKYGEDLDKIYEVLENLEDIIAGLKQKTNILQDSSVNTIGSNSGDSGYNIIGGYGGSTINYGNRAVQELDNGESFMDLEMMDLKDKIEDLQKQNEDLIGENMVALKAAAAGNDQNVQKQLAAYKDGNKTFNNVLIGLGASMWLLILLGLMYNANLNLRNKKRIEAIDEDMQEVKGEIKEAKQNNDEQKELLNKILADNERIKDLLEKIVNKKL